MKPLRAIIAEDEELMRLHLRSLLAALPNPPTVVAEATDGGEAVRLVEEHQPDLLFLDVQMPVLDGFGVIDQLMLGNRVPEIIFTTAYDRYALKAFELNAAHYLLKPITAERLAAAVQRAADRLDAHAALTAAASPSLQSHEEELRQLLAAVRTAAPARPAPPPLAGLTAKARDQIIVIPLDAILHISAEDGLNFIHTIASRHLTDFTLDELEARLDPAQFLRIYRSHIVALRHIKALVPWVDGRFQVILDDPAETRLNLSRYRLAEMRAHFPW